MHCIIIFKTSLVNWCQISRKKMYHTHRVWPVAVGDWDGPSLSYKLLRTERESRPRIDRGISSPGSTAETCGET